MENARRSGMVTVMSVRIKICGITHLEDALAAVACGADALGFMFYPKSSRFVTPEHASEIIRCLPPFISRVGVFVNEDAERIREIVSMCGLDTLQFHGDEPPGFTREFEPVKTIKAIRVRNAESIGCLPDHRTDAWLLDSYVAGQEGGTGEQFNWDLAVEASTMGRPIILAGGLTPENVADAIRHVLPYGVDVSSGVESSPGRKDPGKVQAFIEATRSSGRFDDPE